MTDRIEGYAAAIFELASAEGELEQVEHQLYTTARTLDASAELRSTLTDRRLPLERKQAILEDLLGGRASELTVNVISFIVAQGRGGDLSDIADALAARATRARSREVAEVRSAIPLDEATVERLAEAISRATGKQVEVRTVVDPTVVGGIVARVGDVVIDGSVRRRLENLRETLQSR